MTNRWTDDGVDTVAEVCASEPLTMLVNNAGVAHYMPLAELSAEKATLRVCDIATRWARAELVGTGMRVQVVCPGVVATEFHERQGLDLSAIPRMTAADVVTASLRGLELGEVVCAPEVEDGARLVAVSEADLAAFGAQSIELADRHRVA